MTAFEYTLPAVRGKQAGRDYFVTMCPLQLVPRLFQLDEATLRPALRAQRVLNKGRVPEIARYIAGHARSYVLSSLTASIDGAAQFEALPGNPGTSGLGYLKVPMIARFLLHDGLHRCAAIEAALKARPELAEETVSLVLFVDPGLRRAEQMFTDLKRNETRSARSQGILYDHRDEMARLTKALVGRVAVFADLTEMLRSTISNRSLKLFTLSGIYHATKILLAHQQELTFSAKLSLATTFWKEVAKQIPPWQHARAREVSPAELRSRYIHAHALALAALARAGRDLMKHHPGSWRRRLHALQSVDWSRENVRLWEGRAMIAGRLSKSTTCVLLTGNAIKRHLGVPLTGEEQEAEDRLNSRA
jgi:DNA sulfur modification protein DndB